MDLHFFTFFNKHFAIILKTLTEALAPPCISFTDIRLQIKNLLAGALGSKGNSTVVNEQINYIQINNTILNKEKL